MRGKICYLGDDRLRARPAIWPAIMLHHGLAFDYVPSDARRRRRFRFGGRMRSTW